MLKPEYFQSEDTLSLAQNLLGKFIFTRIDGVVTGGIIVETEAYMGAQDKACHAYGMRRTKRTEVMYKAGGVFYVFLCYGIHSLLNIVTHREGEPHAVLIRSIVATDGFDEIVKRRKVKVIGPSLTQGPGSVTQALGITLGMNGSSVMSDEIWVEERGIAIPKDGIRSSPRVGVDYAGEYKDMPWRYYLNFSHNTVRTILSPHIASQDAIPNFERKVGSVRAQAQLMK